MENESKIEMNESVCDEIPETEEIEAAEETPADELMNVIRQKCEEAKTACREMAERVVRDFKEADGNPYFRQTCTYKLEVYRDKHDTEPIDTFCTEETHGFSTRALMILGGAAVFTTVVANSFVKKITRG